MGRLFYLSEVGYSECEIADFEDMWLDSVLDILTEPENIEPVKQNLRTMQQYCDKNDALMLLAYRPSAFVISPERFAQRVGQCREILKTAFVEVVEWQMRAEVEEPVLMMLGEPDEEKWSAVLEMLKDPCLREWKFIKMIENETGEKIDKEQLLFDYTGTTILMMETEREQILENVKYLQSLGMADAGLLFQEAPEFFMNCSGDFQKRIRQLKRRLGDSYMEKLRRDPLLLHGYR